MPRSDGWGEAEGKETAEKLLKLVASFASADIFEISLVDVERNDASFARESVIAVAMRYRGTKGFYLSNINSVDLLDNWIAGADALNQPINVHIDKKVRIIGSKNISHSAQKLLNYVNTIESTTATEVSRILDLKLTNASTQLNKLREQGFILRREMSAQSGGKEYQYYRIL